LERRNAGSSACTKSTRSRCPRQSFAAFEEGTRTIALSPAPLRAAA
jgi:hypothetical protein